VRSPAIPSGPGFRDDWFRRVLGHFPAGLVIVTALCDGVPAGMSVRSFTSVSLDPPLVAILPPGTSETWPRIAAAGAFCINVLTARQEELYRAFAAAAPGQDTGRFAGVGWRSARSGAPILSGTLAWIDCDLERMVPAGDHVIVLGRVRALDVEEDEAAEPLVLFQGGYGTFSGRPAAARPAASGR